MNFILAFLLVAAMLVAVVHLGLFSNVFLDDAFITYRYSEHLANGFGPVWNLNEAPVEGYTNFLWMVFNAGFIKLGLHPLFASKILGCISAFLLVSIPLTGCFGLLLGLNSRLVVVMLTAFCPVLMYYGQGGLETDFFALLVCMAVYLYCGYLNNKSNIFLYFAGVLCGLSALCRPEGLGVFGIILIWQIICKLRVKSQNFADVFFYSISFLIFWLPYFLWRLNYYGFPFPNTYYAKHSDGGWDQIFLGLNYVAGGCSDYLGLALLYGAMGVYAFCGTEKEASKRKQPELGMGVAFLLFFISSYSCYVIAVGGDDPQAFLSYRLLLPVIPIAYLLIGFSYSIFENMNRLNHLRYLPAVCLIGLTLLADVRESYLLLKSNAKGRITSKDTGLNAVMKLFVVDKRIFQEPEDSKWIKKRLPHGGLVALPWAGAVPYYSKVNCIDTLGLNDVHIAHTKKLQRGIDVKMDAEYVVERKPDLIFINVDREVVLGTKSFEEGRGWKIGDKELLLLLKTNPNYSFVESPSHSVCFEKRK